MTISSSPACSNNRKNKLPFYLYAYCLMPNHFHLLIEMQDDLVSRIMQRVLTGYSRYHNRKYKKVWHLFQGRYKSILCQTDRYLGELVRCIHLNPVRAKIALDQSRLDRSRRTLPTYVLYALTQSVEISCCALSRSTSPLQTNL